MSAIPALTTAQELVQARRINQAIINAMKIAKIKVIVNDHDFVDILKSRKADRNTVALLEPDEDVHHRVTIRPPRNRPVTFDRKKWPVWVKPGGATIRFRIVSNSNKEIYYPLSIAFVRRSDATENVLQCDRIGQLNFDQSKIRPDKDCIYVTDGYRDGKKDDKYKFSIVIQRKRDGAIGIIDPPWEHEN